MLPLVVVALAASAVSPLRLRAPSPTMQADLQKMLDGLAADSGYAIQLGFKNADTEFSVAAGSIHGKNVTTSDTFLFGSGTKPFTATAIMQQVEKGVLKLEDKVSTIIDPVLKKMPINGSTTTFVKMFGSKAASVTVGMLLTMQAGVPDYDVPEYDDQLLMEPAASATHSPIEVLSFAATLPWVCDPGTCVSYSSTNFVLAGLVLVGAAGAGETWETYDMKKALLGGSLASEFPVTEFFRTEKISKYLTVPGESGREKPTTIIDQSSTILWWTCGNMVTTTTEVARFFFNLLGKSPTVVKPETVKSMENFTPLNKGWASGAIQYGTGLMIQAVSPTASLPPKIGDDATYVGHGGDTYGFLSENGYIPQLEAAMSVIANEDGEGNFVKETAFCSALQILYKGLAGKTVDLKCRSGVTLYSCQKHTKQCTPAWHGGEAKADCESTCGK